MPFRSSRHTGVSFNEQPTYHLITPPSSSATPLPDVPRAPTNTPAFEPQYTSNPNGTPRYPTPPHSNSSGSQNGYLTPPIPPSPTLRTVPLPTTPRSGSLPAPALHTIPLPPTTPQPNSSSPSLRISPILDVDSAKDHYHWLTVLHDIRDRSDEVFVSNTACTITPSHLPSAERSTLIISRAVKTIHLVSDLFNWIITVHNPEGVTCQNVLESVHEELFQNVVEKTPRTLEQVARASETIPVNRRYDPTYPADRMYRFDLLGERTVFRGLRWPRAIDEVETRGKMEHREDMSEGLCLSLVLRGPGRDRPGSYLPSPSISPRSR
jgi:hypothetical protein